MNDSRIISPFVPEFIPVSEVITEFLLQFRRQEAQIRLSRREDSQLGGNTGGLGEQLDELLHGEPFAVSDQVLPGPIPDECLDKRSRILVGRDERQLEICFQVSNEVNDTVSILNTSASPLDNRW